MFPAQERSLSRANCSTRRKEAQDPQKPQKVWRYCFFLRLLRFFAAIPDLILLNNLQLLFRTFFDWGRGQADQTQLRARQQLPTHRFCRL